MAFVSVNVHNKKAVVGTIAREVLHFVHNELAQCCQTAFLELPCLLPLCCVVLKLFSTADEAATPSMTRYLSVTQNHPEEEHHVQPSRMSPT